MKKLIVFLLMAIVVISTVVGQTLVPISKITVEENDGKETISADFKAALIDHVFSGFSQPGRATEKTGVMVYNVKTPVNFFGMLSSLGRDLSKMWLTQAQIISICENNPWLFKDQDFHTFFLCRSNDNSYAQTYYVVSIYVNGGSKFVFYNNLGRDMKWSECAGNHLVVPEVE